jgi:hypothetical protein
MLHSYKCSKSVTLFCCVQDSSGLPLDSTTGAVYQIVVPPHDQIPVNWTAGGWVRD